MFSLRLPGTLLLLICFWTIFSLQAQNSLLTIEGPDVVCVGSCATFRGVTTGTSVLNARYEWRATNNALVVGTGASVQICFNTSSATSVITLRVTLADGNTSEATRSVRIQSAQPLQIIAGNANPLCAADSTDGDDVRCQKVCPNTTVTYFLNGAAPSSGQEVRWQVNGARRFRPESTGTAVTVEWGSSGTGTVAVTVPGACGGQAALCVTIVEAPHARITAFPAAKNDTISICRGQKVELDGTGSTAEQLTWLLHDGGLVTAAATEKTYDRPGLYRVQLVARSACVCTDTAGLFVRVLDAAAPQLACAAGTHCPGATVQYGVGNNPDGCTGFIWEVSPNGRLTAGGAPGDSSVTVEWLTGPAGFISLRAQNCRGAVCPTPSVARIPIVSGGATIRGPRTVCANTEAIYAIDAFNGTQYTWSLSGGGTLEPAPDGTSAIVRWSAPPDPNRRYWLTVQYTNCWLGCSGRDSLSVQVQTPFDISGPERGCAGTNAAFSAALANGNPISGTWSLLGPDDKTVWSSGAPGANVSLPLPAQSGLYRLRMQAADASMTCTPATEWPVQVSGRPQVLAGIVGDSLFCPGDLVTYATSGGAATAVQWQLQNGVGAPVRLAGNPVNIAWRTTGPHRLSAWAASAEGCSSDTATFRARPVSSFSISGISAVCEGATGLYRAPALQSAAYEWKIQPPTAGAIARGQGTNEVEIFWQQPGGHVLTATLCGQTEVIPVTVWSNPNPAVVLPTGVCPGKQAFIKTTTPFDVFTWRDAAGVGIGTADSILLGPGNYSVEVKSGLGCSSALGFRIAAAPAPVIAISTTDPAGFCNNGRTVKLQALTNTGGDYRYTWRRDGAPLPGSTSAFSSNQYGTYTVEVTNAAGCTAVSNPLTLFNYCGGGGGAGGGFLNGAGDFCPPGSGTIAVDPSSRCDSARVRVVPGINYVAGSANWTFLASGAPALGTRQGDTAAFIFPNAGQYLAFAAVRLQNGTACMLADSLKVSAVARFERTPACANDSTAFSDISAFLPGTGISSWQWAFGEPASGAANTASGRNVRHAYQSGGVFTAQLTITASSGCTSTAQQTIGIPVQPTPAILAPVRGCAGQTAAFIAPRQGDWTNIAWNFDDPASDVSNRAVGDTVFHRFATAGTYRVSVTVANTAACITTVTHTIDIQANGLTGTIAPARPPVVCAGQQTLLTAPAGGTVYRWSNGAATPVLAAVTEGVYRVTLTDANGCQYAPPPVAVSIRPGPAGRIRALLKNEAGQTVGLRDSVLRVCASTPVNLFIASGSGFTFRWSGGQTGADLVLSPALNNALPVGAYQFTVTITDPASGCTTVTPVFRVQVDPLPPALSIVSSGSACVGANSELRLSGALTGNEQLRWNTGQTTSSLAVRTAGTYFLTAINEFGCTRNSNSIAVRPPPGTLGVPSGCHDRCKPDTICVPPMPQVVRWQWLLNGTPLTGATTPRLSPMQNGNYQAVLTDAFGCTALSNVLSLQVGERIGVVSGLVWADVNKNGRIDPGVDTLTREVRVRLSRNDTLVGDARSGPQGNFAFMSQPTGFTYVATVDSLALPKGWRTVIGRVPAPLQGCGAEAQVAFLVLPRCQKVGPTVVLRVCAGDSAVYEGMRIAPGQQALLRYQTGADCDSTVTVLASAYPLSTGRVDTFACAGTSLRFGNLDIPAGSSQRLILKNFRGCDSVLTVNVLGYPRAASVLRTTVCRNATFRYEGASVLPGETRTFRLKTWRGCDSVVTVVVDSFRTPVTTLRPQVCAGGVFVYEGSSLTPGRQARFVLRSFRGCDSIVNVLVGSLPSPRTTLTPKICPGETFRFGGQSLKPGETEDFAFSTVRGCDSVVTVIVSAWPAPRGRIETLNTCRSQPNGLVALRDVADGQPPYRFSLDQRSFQSQPVFDRLPVGTGTLYLADSAGCQHLFPYSIGAAVPLAATLADAVLPCDSAGVTLLPRISGDTTQLTFRWWDGTRHPTAVATDFGPVWVVTATRCDTVRSNARVRPGNFRSEDLVYVPNAFAPEGAIESNTLFAPLFHPEVAIRQYNFRIYDRWGTQLFAAAEPGTGWDGIFQQKAMQPGVYVWVLDAQIFYCGREKRLFRKGDVTVIK